MEIPIVIEPVAGRGYRANFAPLALSVEGDTREEALARLTAQLQARISAGASIVPVQIPAAPHPLAKFSGMFKDDPWLDDWKQSMAEYRKSIESDPDAL